MGQQGEGTKTESCGENQPSAAGFHRAHFNCGHSKHTGGLNHTKEPRVPLRSPLRGTANHSMASSKCQTTPLSFYCTSNTTARSLLRRSISDQPLKKKRKKERKQNRTTLVSVNYPGKKRQTFQNMGVDRMKWPVSLTAHLWAQLRCVGVEVTNTTTLQ